MTVVLYTDGSCSAKDRIGGWAYVSPRHDLINGYGYAYDTTISRMELTAVICGLAHVGEELGPRIVTVRSDSEYVVKGASDRTRARNVNNDLWDMLDEVVDLLGPVIFEHVKGHAGHEFNEKADQMAGGARNYAKLLKDEEDA